MNVLTFVDPSPRGEWSLRLTAEFAGRLAHRVVLLATEEDAGADPGMLDRAASAVGGLEAVVVEKKVRPGRPRRVIIEEASENLYELTIFPPAGRNGLQRLLQGSRVRSVVRHIPSSVLVARRPSARIRRILAAVSASPFGQTTVGAGLEIAKALESDLTAIHVVSKVPLPAGEEPPGGGLEEAPDARPEGVLEKVREEFEAAGRKPKIVIREGLVVEEVIQEVDAGNYDLLVVGHHIAAHLQADLQQDLSERLILWCPIPVLVIQPRKVAARTGP